MNSPERQPDPLHGVTLEMILQRLVEVYGWEELGSRIRIRCFNLDPSIKSSLQFLRRTPWARAKVERLFLQNHRMEARRKAREAKASEAPSTPDASERRDLPPEDPVG